MQKHNFSFLIILLFFFATLASNVNAQQQMDLYNDGEYALGIGAAIVGFDTNIKKTDKQSGHGTYLDLEGNLDLPEVSTVTTFYGAYQFNTKHSIGFSFFNVNRESEIFNIDKTFEDVSVIGMVSISDKTDFYRFNYGYNLFNDAHSKIDLIAGIYALDLSYVFKAEGEITINGVKTTGLIDDATNVFAPLPLIGLDFKFRITDSWSFSTKVAFVTGSHNDLSASVFQTSINALYKVNKYFGFVMGLTYFDADVFIEDDLEKQDISYGYDGAYIGMHFIL